jgi:transcriptional regulator GlxA family with amidase domain
LPKLSDLLEIYNTVGKPSLRDEPFDPRMPAALATTDDIFSIVRAGDVLLHRPYDSYNAVAELVQAAADDPDVQAWLRRMADRVQRLGSICTGSLVLAAAGLLDGRRATTHWAYCERLGRMAPGCEVEPDAIFVQDANLFTSAGVTTGMDMALEMVEQDHGKAVAVSVAQELVIYRKRPGGQAQFSRFLEAERREDRMGELQLWILDRLDEDLPLERLAAAAAMSPRHFSRRFKAELGVTPAAYVARVRLEEARRRLESGAHSLKDVARTCGFADEQNLRRAFRKHVGVAPSEYRERFG